MSSKQYDETFKRAAKARVTIPEQVRQDMRNAARREKE
jgi:hypothetical protein